MLHSAVLAGDVEAVRFLVENGAGNVRDRDGKVPLWYALQHRDADVRGRLEAELGAHAAQILVEVEDAVQSVPHSWCRHNNDNNKNNRCGSWNGAVEM